MQRKIFISYTICDEPWAKLIGDVLEEMGHLVVAMYQGFDGIFLAKIEEAYDTCDNIILVFSPNYQESNYCRLERSAAINMDMGRENINKKNHTIMVKIDPTPIPNLYSAYNYIDLSSYDTPGSADVRSYFREEIAKRFKDEIRAGPRQLARNNLPNRIPNFTGRKQIIEELHQHFTSGSRQHSVQVLTGLSGVGKTKISLEYAYSYLDDYLLIWYFHAEEKTALMQEVSELAKTLYPGEHQENIDLLIAAFRRYLENNDRWLLIFDNATKPEDIEWIFPAVIRGNIIITSMNPNWGTLACILPIKPFSIEESVEFLEKRLHRNNEQNCFKSVTRELDHIPIVLEIAAAYMDTSQINCEEYRDILKESPVHISPLTKVWGASFTKIKEGSEKSISLLEYLSYLSPDNIPEEVIYPMLRHTPDLSDHLKNKAGYLEILSYLLRYSFVSKDIDSRVLSMHRIVQKAVQAAMEDEIKKKKASSTVKILSELFPIKSDDPETIDHAIWIKCQQMLPHAIKVAGLAENLKVAPEPTIHLYAQVASFLRELNNLKEAEQYVDKALSIIESTKKSDTLLHAICLETRSRILRDIGRNDEAKDLMLHAINIEEKLQREASTDNSGQKTVFDVAHLAICYDGYGRILSNLCQHRDSLEFYNKALSLDFQKYGESDPKIAIRKNNIGCAYGRLGNDELHIKYLKEALTIDEKYYTSKNEPNHPHIAIRLCNLALAYEKNVKPDPSSQDRLDLACTYWERARKINEGFYGLSSQHTLSSIYGLAGHFCIRKDYEKALMQNNKAIEITQDSDPGGFYHAQSYLYRGNTYIEMENFTDAINDYQKAAELVSCSRGTDCLDYSIILRNIAYSRFREGDYPAAAEMQQKSLEIDTKNNRTTGSGYGIALLNLGIYCIQSQDDINAKKAFFKALPVLEKEFGTYSDNYFYALCRYIELKIQLNDTADISELIHKGQTIQEYFEKQHTKGN